MRASLFLAALAVVFVVPLSATHLACEHADAPSTDQHHCAVCRHLEDGTPILAASPPIAAPTPITDLCVRSAPAAADSTVPITHGRAPPATDPAS